MDFLNKYNLSPMKILKIAGLGLAGIIVVIFIFGLIGPFFNQVIRTAGNQNLSMKSSLGLSEPASYGSGAVNSTPAYDSAMPELSARNIAPIPTDDTVITGDTAEDYEVTDYSGTIKTRQLKKTCAALFALKARDYVIFENANEYDQGCNYTFKVKSENKDEILSIVKSLNPRTLVENTRTIKRQIDDYTSETEILKNKLAVIESTLNDAIASYDEISKLATQQRDAASLAKIIDSKIGIIERLTQQRININAQLDRLSRAKTDQLDRIDYVYFRLNVYENKFIDGQSIRDSWEAAIKKFVTNMNNVLQAISVNLVFVIFTVLQYVLYLLIILLALKYLWKFTKYIWRK